MWARARTGAGIVVPEINFTLPAIEINESNWPEIRRQYHEIIDGISKRSVELEVPGLLVEFETLPEMTNRPQWGIEVVEILSTTLREYQEKHGLKSALRFTPNDTREFLHPSRMRSGEYWDTMKQVFDAAAGAGADLLSIESTGGKEVCDEALQFANLREMVFGLSILGARDMEFLWQHMVGVCRKTSIVAGGDSACAFGNTAMVLADQRFIPKVSACDVNC